MAKDQPSLFDGDESERAKKRGMKGAAIENDEILSLARKIAKELALKHPLRECNADLVQAELLRRGRDIHELGNAAGSLFKTDEWVWTGKRVKSVRVHAHANELKVWRFVGKDDRPLMQGTPSAIRDRM